MFIPPSHMPQHSPVFCLATTTLKVRAFLWGEGCYKEETFKGQDDLLKILNMIIEMKKLSWRVGKYSWENLESRTKKWRNGNRREKKLGEQCKKSNNQLLGNALLVFSPFFRCGNCSFDKWMTCVGSSGWLWGEIQSQIFFDSHFATHEWNRH